MANSASVRSALRAIGPFLALMICGPALAAPGNSLTVSGSADARVIEPIGIQNVADLRFGRMMQPTANGRVVISPAGAVSTTGGMTGLTATPQATNGRGPGAFAVFGDAGRRFVIFMPNSTTISNGTSTMVVNQFRNNITGLGQFGPTGYAPLLVGARLNVNANQQVGTYSGTYDVTVLYL